MKPQPTAQGPRRQARLVAWATWATWAACGLPSLSNAHELAANRATVVQRDDTHWAITCLIDYPQLLHRMLAPKRSWADFVVQAAAMPLAEFQQSVARAHQQVATRLLLTGPGGERVALRNWQWPEAPETHKRLQAGAMQLITGGGSGAGDGSHGHGTETAVRAEALSAQPLKSLAVRFPAEFGRVLVVSYRPQQAWTENGTTTLRLRF